MSIYDALVSHTLEPRDVDTDLFVFICSSWCLLPCRRLGHAWIISPHLFVLALPLRYVSPDTYQFAPVIEFSAHYIVVHALSFGRIPFSPQIFVRFRLPVPTFARSARIGWITKVL